LPLLVERFQNSNHMGSPKGPHFAVASPNTATDQNHGIDRLVNLGLGKAVTVEIKTGASAVCPPIKHDTLREW
jgi:hypothetical protein